MKRLLVSVLAALVLVVTMVMPLSADSATITVNTNVVGLNATCTVTVTNPNDYPIFIYNVTDTVFNSTYTVTIVPTMYDILSGYVEIPAHDSHQWVFEYSFGAEYLGNTLIDLVHVDGKTDVQLTSYNVVLQFPYDYTVPLPEIASGVLVALGVTGLGGFVLYRRKQSSKSV
jgi:hypothetical protein